MSPGFPTWSSARGQPPTCPTAPASSSTTAARGRRAGEARQHRDRGGRDPRPRAGSPRLPRHRPPPGAQPWLVLTGDALLIGDAGRPDLHAHGDQTVEEMARHLYHSLTERLMTLPDHLALYPAHFSAQSVAADSQATPSRRGFERRHNAALQFDSEQAFVGALPKASRRHRSTRRDPGRQPLAESRTFLGSSQVRLGLRENLAQFSPARRGHALWGRWWAGAFDASAYWRR